MQKGDVKKASALMMCTVFVGFLLMFAVGCIAIPFQGINAVEQRNYAEKPKLDAESLKDGSFMTGLEDYLKDRLIFRPQLVMLRSDLRSIFGRTLPRLVYSGKDCQLMLRSFYYESELKEAAASYRSFAEKHSVPVDVIVCPDAAEILSEQLPAGAVTADEDEVAERFTAAVGDSVTVYYPKEEIIRMKDAGTQVYYRTDQHWTTDCAEGVLGWYMEQAGIPRPEVNYEAHYQGNFYGNLYSASPSFFSTPDTIKYYTNPAGEYTVTKSGSSGQTDSLLEMGWIMKLNKYNIFLGGVFEAVHIRSNAKGGKLLLVGDSYVMPMVQLLADCFEEVLLVDNRQMPRRGVDLEGLMGDFEPDRVLFVNTVYQISGGAVKGF